MSSLRKVPFKIFIHAKNHSIEKVWFFSCHKIMIFSKARTVSFCVSSRYSIFFQKYWVELFHQCLNRQFLSRRRNFHFKIHVCCSLRWSIGLSKMLKYSNRFWQFFSDKIYVDGLYLHEIKDDVSRDYRGDFEKVGSILTGEIEQKTNVRYKNVVVYKIYINIAVYKTYKCWLLFWRCCSHKVGQYIKCSAI